MVPNSALPPAIPFTDHVGDCTGWLIMNCWLAPAKTVIFAGSSSGGFCTPHPMVKAMPVNRRQRNTDCLDRTYMGSGVSQRLHTYTRVETKSFAISTLQAHV